MIWVDWGGSFVIINITVHLHTVVHKTSFRREKEIQLYMSGFINCNTSEKKRVIFRDAQCTYNIVYWQSTAPFIVQSTAPLHITVYVHNVECVHTVYNVYW